LGMHLCPAVAYRTSDLSGWTLLGICLILRSMTDGNSASNASSWADSDPAARCPPYDCLFCRSKEHSSFTRVEHPIPESLGNDDLTLAPGSVCDSCNQYFGAKIEARVLASPPFNIERTRQAIKTKKRRLPRFEGEGFSLVSTGGWDTVFVVAPPNDQEKARRMLSERTVYASNPNDYADLMARFLLKMGIELLATADQVNPYSDVFDRARRCARFGERMSKWDVAYGLYPRPDHLKISSRMDEFGRLETRQIYQYEMGMMASRDIVLCFVFANHVFACNLSREPLTEYLLGFNARNKFALRSRWHTR
jgi:hypothetical protein